MSVKKLNEVLEEKTQWRKNLNRPNIILLKFERSGQHSCVDVFVQQAQTDRFTNIYKLFREEGDRGKKCTVSTCKI